MEHTELVMERTTLEDLPPLLPSTFFVIREYTPGDEAAWTRIQTAADRYNTITPTLFFREFGRDASEHARRVLFASHNEQPIGTSTAWWGAWQNDEWGRVHWVAVLPEWQRKGVGRALLIAACHRLRELGHSKAFLTTAPVRTEALRLYRSIGFNTRQDP